MAWGEGEIKHCVWGGERVTFIAISCMDVPAIAATFDRCRRLLPLPLQLLSLHLASIAATYHLLLLCLPPPPFAAAGVICYQLLLLHPSMVPPSSITQPREMKRDGGKEK